LNILGNAYLALHDYPKAVKAFEQCLARSTEIGDQERVVGSQWNLAVALADAGDLRASIESAKRAVAGMRLLTTGADEALSRSMRENFDNVFVVGASAAEHVGDVAAAAYFVESGRAGTLLDSLRGREALRAAAMPQELLDAETAARAVETAAVAELRRALESRKVADIAARRADVDAARTALADVIARIQREAKAAAGVLYAESDPLEVLQRRLRDGEVLVLYTTDAFQQVLALVIGRDSARIAKIAAAKDVETACAALNADDPAADTASAVAALRRLVVDPLALDAKTTQLLISPDGALSYVPFALLCAECEVAYVPSGTTYGLLLDERGKKGEGVLALGDPDYGAKPAAPATPDAVAMRGGMKLVRLPATGVEAKAVGDVVLVGKDASEQGLRDAVAKRPRWHAVHLACHGLIDPERPMFSSLALTPAGEDDGFLTALEVFQMKTPADLVVLSACETGKGKVMKAEGIVGLTRAFMFAGAPRVIVSLWKVDDQATAALMAKFYEGFKKGVPAARALRDAQAYVRAQEKWKHPFYWAAWALWGLPD
jgi:CHAT domain-containing protein